MAKVKGRNEGPERGRSAMEDEMMQMGDMAFRLCEKAVRKGVSAAYIITAYDPFTGTSHSHRGLAGDYHAIIGATHKALKLWEDES